MTDSASAMTGATPYLRAISGSICFATSTSMAPGSMLTYLSPNASAIVPRTSSSEMAPDATSTSSVVSFSSRIAWDATSSCSAVTYPPSRRSCSTYSSFEVIFLVRSIANPGAARKRGGNRGGNRHLSRQATRSGNLR